MTILRIFLNPSKALFFFSIYLKTSASDIVVINAPCVHDTSTKSMFTSNTETLAKIMIFIQRSSLNEMNTQLRNRCFGKDGFATISFYRKLNTV